MFGRNHQGKLVAKDFDGAELGLLGDERGDAEVQTWLASFVQGLRELGWIDGSNVLIVTHWTTDDVGRQRAARVLAQILTFGADGLVVRGEALYGVIPDRNPFMSKSATPQPSS